MPPPVITIADLAEHEGREVSLRGWVYNWRKKGKLRFIILRDGFGYLQCVVFRPEVEDTVWQSAVELTQESSVELTGTLVADERAPGGYELKLSRLQPIQIAPEYPIGKKDHGPDFLLNNRHLWLRSRRQPSGGPRGWTPETGSSSIPIRWTTTRRRSPTAFRSTGVGSASAGTRPGTPSWR